MPLQIVRNDITKMKCDAVVNAAKSSLLGGGGVDGAIHKAAGKKLLLECMTLGGCQVGQAKITGGYNLPARYVIHTVGPKWQGGGYGEKEFLESCYRESLKLALKNGCESVAFPLISSGIYGYPKDQALRVAVDAISEYLIDHDMMVYIVVFDKNSFQIGTKLFYDIASYIDDKYVDAQSVYRRTRFNEAEDSIILEQPQMPGADEAGKYFAACPEQAEAEESTTLGETRKFEADESVRKAPVMKAPKTVPLEDMINQIDESFSQMLLRKIDEKHMTDAQCYKKANIDRKLFSKIRNDVGYKPKKQTVIAFAIALELPLEETKEMLMKAGFALSHSNKFDIIIEYFIINGNYDVFQINEALFAFDQNLLGA